MSPKDRARLDELRVEAARGYQQNVETTAAQAAMAARSLSPEEFLDRYDAIMANPGWEGRVQDAWHAEMLAMLKRSP